MSLLTSARTGSQRPAFLTLPADRRGSDGDEAIELAALAGLTLDDWQQFCLTEMLQRDARGLHSAFEAAVVVPRQNGKGGLLEARQLWGLFLGGEVLQVHTAHEFKTCFEHFLRIVSLIENTPDLDAKVQRIRRGAGEQAVELKSGERLRFLARSAGSGRGFSGDAVYLDEAYALTAPIMGALLPTMSAVPNPQLVYTSSAPSFAQPVLFDLVQRGRQGGSPRLFYAEWGNEENVDRHDKDAWYRANPALGIRIDEAFIEAELEAMQSFPEEFLRERLGVVQTSDASTILPLAKWRTCTDPHSTAEGGTAALSVGPGSLWAALGYAARRPDGLLHVEVARHEQGTGWVLDACQKAYADTGQPIIVDPKSPSSGVIDRLEAAGIPLHKISFPEFTTACVAFQDDLHNERLRHLGQERLTAAVSKVAIRTFGESWVFSARASEIDITPLLAVVVATINARGSNTSEFTGGFHDLSDFLTD